MHPRVYVLIGSMVMLLPRAVHAAPSAKDMLDACIREVGGNDVSGDVATDYPGGLAKKAGALTPAEAPGATTVTTEVAACLVAKHRSALVIIAAMDEDEGIPGSYRWPFAGKFGDFGDRFQKKLERELTRVAPNKATPILTYCHHTRCFLSYNAVLRLAKAGYTNVYWAREGIKGWLASKRPVDPVRAYDGGLLTAAMLDIDNGRSKGKDDDYPRAPDHASDSYFRPINGLHKSLCGALLAQNFSRESARDIWTEKLFAAAGVAADDPDDVKVDKVQDLWGRVGHLFLCEPGLRTIPHRANVLKLAYVLRNKDFLLDVIEEWHVPMNAVDPEDGRTFLDFLLDNAKKGAIDGWDRHLYRVSRRNGARHRHELEAEGRLKTPAQLQAEYLPLYNALAEKGDLDAMAYLQSVLRQGAYVRKDVAAARDWLTRIEKRALAINHTETILWLSERYEEGSGDFAKDSAKALRLLELAVANKSRDAYVRMGRAYELGTLVGRDNARALHFYLLASKIRPLAYEYVAIGRVLWELGRKDEAVKYLRGAAQMGYRIDNIYKDLEVHEFLKKHGYSECGVNIEGWDACAPKPSSSAP